MSECNKKCLGYYIKIPNSTLRRNDYFVFHANTLITDFEILLMGNLQSKCDL